MIRLSPISKDSLTKIDSLMELFMRDRNILFAYLFGGMAEHGFHPLGDIDLALYLSDVRRLDYLETFGKIAGTLGTEEIDLVILNTAPLSLTGRILQNRKVLMDRAPFFRHQYESLILRKYFDFSIKERDILKRRYGIG